MWSQDGPSGKQTDSVDWLQGEQKKTQAKMNVIIFISDIMSSSDWAFPITMEEKEPLAARDKGES